MKRRTIVFFIMLFVTILFVPYQSAEASGIYYYIDGQEQRYQGEVVDSTDGLWIPIKPILSNLRYINAEWDLDMQTINQYLRDKHDDLDNPESPEEKNPLIEFLDDLVIKQINNRDMIHFDDVQRLGFDAFYFKNDQIIHINTPGLMEIGGLIVGDDRDKVERLFPDIHWNTGFGQEADLIGFVGDMHSYSYLDRYGYERKGEVADLQIEINDDHITYLFASSEQFPTSKQIKVGDKLNDVYRAYGNQYIRDRVDDKQIVVYDVEFGSIWFIADKEQVIERIAYWDHQLRGFGEAQIEEIKENDRLES